MDPVKQKQFELAMIVVKRAFCRFHHLTDPNRIYSWCLLKDLNVAPWTFCDLIRKIDLNMIAKAIQLHDGTRKEEMIGEIPSATEEEINYYFSDKEWPNATVGEFINKIIDFVDYKMSLLHDALQYPLQREREIFDPLIQDQALLLQQRK